MVYLQAESDGSTNVIPETPTKTSELSQNLIEQRSFSSDVSCQTSLTLSASSPRKSALRAKQQRNRRLTNKSKQKLEKKDVTAEDVIRYCETNVDEKVATLIHSHSSKDFPFTFEKYFM